MKKVIAIGEGSVTQQFHRAMTEAYNPAYGENIFKRLGDSGSSLLLMSVASNPVFGMIGGNFLGPTFDAQSLL